MRLSRINLAIVLLLPMPALSLNSISPVREEEDIVRHPEKQRPTYGIQTLMRSGKRTISVNRLKIQISFSSWIYLGNYTKESPNRIIGRAYLVMIETVSLFIFLFIFFFQELVSLLYSLVKSTIAEIAAFFFSSPEFFPRCI